RRAWDDFQVAVVDGSDDARTALLGSTHDWPQFAPLFRDRYAVRGAHFIGHDELDDAWHPEDMLLVLMRGSDGEVTGILSVDEPVSGRRPNDRELDALIAVANAAGAALQQARESAAEAQHQSALQQLLAVSTRIADARS